VVLGLKIKDENRLRVFKDVVAEEDIWVEEEQGDSGLEKTAY
jgi:hypothetical protein